MDSLSDTEQLPLSFILLIPGLGVAGPAEEEGFTKKHGINEELKEGIKTKDTTMKETENKAENIKRKNEKDIERLSDSNLKKKR